MDDGRRTMDDEVFCAIAARLLMPGKNSGAAATPGPPPPVSGHLPRGLWSVVRGPWSVTTADPGKEEVQ